MANNAKRKRDRIEQEQARARAAKEKREHLQAQQNTVKEKKQKKKVTASTYLLSGLAMLSIASLGGAVWLSTTDNTVNLGGAENADDGAMVSESAGEERGGIPPAETGRHEAVSAAANLLTEAYVHRDSESEYIEFLEEVEEGNFDEIDDTVVDSVRNVDLFDTESSSITSYQILISYSIMIKQIQGLGEDEAIEPLFDEESIAQNVLYDEEVGVAYVPLSTFAGEQAALTMEMVYVDGTWQVMPYSLMESVSLFDSVTEGDEDMLNFDDLG